MSFILKPSCNCGRTTCGLATGKFDDECILGIFLPAWYGNHIQGSDFLAMKKGEAVEFEDRREAVMDYLKFMGAGKPRSFKQIRAQSESGIRAH